MVYKKLPSARPLLCHNYCEMWYLLENSFLIFSYNVRAWLFSDFCWMHRLILLMEEILHHQSWWLSHFNHPRWCRILSINSMSYFDVTAVDRNFFTTSWRFRAGGKVFCDMTSFKGRKTVKPPTSQGQDPRIQGISLIPRSLCWDVYIFKYIHVYHIYIYTAYVCVNIQYLYIYIYILTVCYLYLRSSNK